MFDMKCVMFLCLSSFLGANAGVVSFIEPCHWQDSKCILESSKKVMPVIIKGVPELGMAPLDPLELKQIPGDTGELKLKFDHLIVKRLSECKLNKVERPEKLKINLEMECPVTANGKYNANGTVLFIDIYGDGDCEIKTDSIKLSALIKLKQFEKNGKKYYKIAGFDYKYEPVKKIDYKFDNLFNGDEAKAAPFIAILNESWKEVITDIGKPVINEIITEGVDIFNKLFTSVPCNELELE